jgi:uncharacterized membrane protein YeaQ/YmgE (transglycosylase-associated protein family)
MFNAGGRFVDQLKQLQPYMPYIVMALNGLIAGWLVSLLLGGGGLFRNLIVGIMGAFVGGLLVKFGIIPLPFPAPVPNFDAYLPGFGNQIAVSTLGAFLVVILARIIGR